MMMMMITSSGENVQCRLDMISLWSLNIHSCCCSTGHKFHKFFFSSFSSSLLLRLHTSDVITAPD